MSRNPQNGPRMDPGGALQVKEGLCAGRPTWAAGHLNADLATRLVPLQAGVLEPVGAD